MIKKDEVLDILNMFEFFQGQRAGRELWCDKPTHVQDEDIQIFKNNIQKIREYVEDNSNNSPTLYLSKEMLKFNISQHLRREDISVEEKIEVINTLIDNCIKG